MIYARGLVGPAGGSITRAAGMVQGVGAPGCRRCGVRTLHEASLRMRSDLVEMVRGMIGAVNRAGTFRPAVWDAGVGIRSGGLGEGSCGVC